MPGILSFGRSSSANDPNHVTVEMNQQPSHAHQRDRDRDASEQGPSHGRDASARSIFSNISIPSLATMRQRERENEMLRQMARADASANRLPSPTPAQLEAGTLNPQAAAAASVGAGPGPGPPALAPAPLVTPPAPATNKSARSRREREEAATLFGPNLANYFGSGNSSSGAIAAPTATASNTNNTTSTPPTLDTTAAASNLNSRRARLGSRGRVRGASLSGLSMMSLGAESVNSLGGVAVSPNDNGAVSAGIMDGSTHDLISQVTKDNNVSVDQVAMSEGVDIETLSRWIEKCAGSYPNPLGAEPSPIPSVTPVCTTLQSYVNLKRNTVRLKIRTDEENRASTQSDKGTQQVDLGPLGPDKHRGLASSSDVNLLRSAPSLSVLPGTACTSAFKDVAASSRLPDPTHSLLFDFDCAAPCASVQVFVRASRKHGSWLNFTPPADGLADTLPDGTPALLAQRGPPPHVLGWPVHVARLGKGFSVGHKVSLPLHLKYYAPPLAAKAEAGAGAGAGAAAVPEHEPEQEQQINSVSAAHGSAKVGESAIPETPAWEMQRRLELELEEQEEESRVERMRRIRQSNANSDGRAGAAYAGPTPAAGSLEATEANANSATPEENANAPTIPAEETKEQRLAREKAERETLKIAVVVEALDENARPLREPNLQTTYLRVTSLPARQPPAQPSSSAEGVDGGEASGLPVPARVWTAQVEGQECEIGPHRFQLQELYGLSTKPPPVRAAVEEGGGGDEEGTAGPSLVADMDDSNGSECLICLSAPPTTLLLPCTHGLCLECAIQLRESVMGMRQSERRRGRTPRRKYACPVCRRGFTSMLHLSKADEKLVAQAEAQAQAQA